jgi:hypothetical protein
MAKWLKCTISNGMFSDEFTVTVHSRNGDPIAVFVPRQAADDENKRVKVKTFEREGRTIAVLPDEHQSVVDVKDSDLQPA